MSYWLQLKILVISASAVELEDIYDLVFEEICANLVFCFTLISGWVSFKFDSCGTEMYLPGIQDIVIKFWDNPAENRMGGNPSEPGVNNYAFMSWNIDMRLMNSWDVQIFNILKNYCIPWN